MSNSSTPQPLPGSPGCFVCDNNQSNPRSLGLRLAWDEGTQTVSAPCTPDQSWCGYENVVHGGLVATVLDECMAWVVKCATASWAFTAEFSIRYKRPITPGVPCTAFARVLENKSRKITAEAWLQDDQKNVLATATATFLPAKGQAVPRS